MSTISVVIPVYNRINMIGKALDSVLSQTHPADEIIVVDDGSTDNVATFIVENYPMVKFISQTNQGQSVARNTGILQSSGDLIALLDSDDRWLPDKLKAQLEIFRINPSLGLLGTQKYKNRLDYRISLKKYLKLKFYPFSSFLKRTWIHPSSVMIPKPVLIEIGMFDKSMRTSEDWDLWARIAYHYPVARIQQPLTAVFEMTDSLSVNRRRQYRYDIEVLAKWNPSAAETYDSQKQLTIQYYQRKILNFTILRGIRLYRYGGPEAVSEFLDQLEKRISLSIFTRAFLYNFFKLLRVTK